MEKIRLKLESLQVETFETATKSEGRGTVDAHQIATRTYGGGCTQTTCPPNHCFCTENLSCNCQ
jgi:hypothetical protein